MSILTDVCRLSMLYICEFCLKYIKSSSILQRHLVSNDPFCFSQLIFAENFVLFIDLFFQFIYVTFGPV